VNDIAYHDIFCIYHPADIVFVRRLAAQMRASGIDCWFDDSDFGKLSAESAQQKAGILQAYTVAIVLSQSSAESQLCNELIQHAVSHSKRIISLIRDDDISVEVHPAIVNNTYLFFRDQDDMVEQIEQLRLHLEVDEDLRLHTELLVAAERWRSSGRNNEHLLPTQRWEEARRWLAGANKRQTKPSQLQVEFIHSSRRQRSSGIRSGTGSRARLLSLVFGVLILVAVGAFLLQIVAGAISTRQADATQTQAAQTQIALADAAATAASKGSVGLIDQLAATSVRISESVGATASAATVVAIEAQATAQARATAARATQAHLPMRSSDGMRLLDAARQALKAGDTELALALTWEAQPALDDPGSAHRLLRLIADEQAGLALDGGALLQVREDGREFALVTAESSNVQIRHGDDGRLLNEWDGHPHEISALAYSPAGDLLAVGAENGEIVIRRGDQIQQRIAAHVMPVSAVAFLSNERLISAGGKPRLALWDYETGELLAKLDEQDGWTIAKLASANHGEIIFGWSTDERQMAQWAAETLDSLPVEFALRGVDSAGRIGYSGGRALPAYPDDPHVGEVLFRDLQSGEVIARIDSLDGSSPANDVLNSEELLFVAFGDEIALMVSEDSAGTRKAALVTIAEGQVAQRFEEELAAQLQSAQFLADELLLSATRDGRLVWWSSADGRLVHEIGASSAAQIVPGALPGTTIAAGSLLLVSEDGVQMQLPDESVADKGLPAGLWASAGKFLAVHDGEIATIHATDTGAEIRSWQAPLDNLRAIYLAVDGSALVAVDNRIMWLLNAEFAEPRALGLGDAGMAREVVFAADGQRFVSLHAELALVWDAQDGSTLAAFPMGVTADAQAAFHDDALVFFVPLDEGLATLTRLSLDDYSAQRHLLVNVRMGALAADGASLALAQTDGSIIVLATTDGRLRRRMAGESLVARKLAVLPGAGRLLAAAGSELHLWHSASGELVARFSHALPVADFSYSPDAAQFVTRDSDDVFRLWQLENIDSLLERIESEYQPRPLTCAEREKYNARPLCL